MIADYSLIPEATLESLIAWITTGRPLGGFCEALVTNNLHEAFQRADDDNLAAMFHTVAWLHNKAPIGSWGSPGVLTDWPERLARFKSAKQRLQYIGDSSGRTAGWFGVSTVEAPCKP